MKKSIPYNKGKRSINTKSKFNKKKGICAILIIILIFYVGYKIAKQIKVQNTNEESEVICTANIENTPVNQNVEDKKDENIVNVDLPEKMGDYKVIGQLVIEKIGVEKNILNKTTDDSLNLSVTKFYGPNINEIGNFCITGHNYKNMLKDTKKIEIGDSLYLINKEEKTKVTYKIFNIYTCNPTDLECLDPTYQGVKEVTLITCNPGGLTRLIIKAKEEA